MNRFQDVWLKVSENGNQFGSEQPADANKNEQRASASNEEQDDTTVKTASAISEGIFGHKLTKSEKKIAGPAVHYALGTRVGGLYGAVAEVSPEVTTAQVYHSVWSFGWWLTRQPCRFWDSQNHRPIIRLRRTCMHWPRTWSMA
jgi:hypothetical protein